MINGHKCWAMGPHGDLDPQEEMTLINRAVVDPGNRNVSRSLCRNLAAGTWMDRFGLRGIDSDAPIYAATKVHVTAL